MQCAYHLGYQSMEGEEQSQEMEVQEEEEQQETGADMPTVLAEFSSVVADTQQYIVADQLTEGETQVAGVCVCVHAGMNMCVCVCACMNAGVHVCVQCILTQCWTCNSNPSLENLEAS